MKTLRHMLVEQFNAEHVAYHDDGVAEFVSTQAEIMEATIETVAAWLGELAQDGQVPVNRDLRDEYAFLIREAGK